MKTQKLIVIAAIICLLVGTSAVAMAQDVDCTEKQGVIQGETIDGNVLVDGDSCNIVDSVILGDVIARNLSRNDYLAIAYTTVEGQIRVAGGSVQLVGVSMPSYDGAPENRIVIRNADTDSAVLGTAVGKGNIVVRRAAGAIGNEIVVLQDNQVLNGDIRCNEPARSNTRSVNNLTPRGRVTCPGN